MSQKTNNILQTIIAIKHSKLSKKVKKLLTMDAFKVYEDACRREDWHIQKEINYLLSL